MQAPVFFSIVSSNYLAYARTLMGSIREHYPDAPRYLLLADKEPGDGQSDLGLFELVLASELPVPHLEHMALRYSILEFNTALKPFAFQWLAERYQTRTIVYLDPDILVLAPLANVLAATSSGALAVITPHLTAPLTDDLSPSELSIMRAGAYNLGFIALGAHPNRSDLVRWWAERLEFGALVDPCAGTFTDQKWIDLVPGLFPDVVILRHPGYNLAYWNLAHRAVTQGADGSLFANGQRVSFVHFSGIDPNFPDSFSKHQDRFDAHALGDLRGLYLQYLRLLRDNGWAHSSRMPYQYGRLRDGTVITPEMRAVFRYWFDIGAPRECHEPFALTASDLRGVVVPRRDPNDPSRRWYQRARDRRVVGAVEARLLPPGSTARRVVKRLVVGPPGPVLVVDRGASDRLTAVSSHASDAVGPVGPATRARANVIGYLTGEFGVAEGARLIIRAAQARSIDLALITVGASATAREEDLRLAHAITDRAIHPVNIMCVNADQTKAVVSRLGDLNFKGRYTVGYWFWELARFPAAWREAIDLVDEIWVASGFVEDCVRSATSKPVVKIPLPVDATPSRAYHRSEFGLPDDRFLFLFTMDYLSFSARKNPTAVITAFKRAFPRGDEPVELVIKTTNGHRKPGDVRALQIAADGDARVRLVDGFLSRDEVFGFESVVDCYVSLHRSEGFGLGLAESMSLGKPVIGTAYSGNMEFMDAGNSCLVGYRLVDVGPGEYPFPDQQVWAEPDLDHAVHHMRRLVDDPAYAADLGERARADIRTRLSVEAIGELIEREVLTILDSQESAANRAATAGRPIGT